MRRVNFSYQRIRQDKWSTLFTISVILLLAVSANLGRINNAISLKARDGGNLIGIRDILIFWVLLIGIIKIATERRPKPKNTLAKIILMVVLLSPLAAAVGLWFGGNPLSVLRDLVTMLGWLLAYVIGFNLRGHAKLKAVSGAIVIMGILVSLGVLIEIVTHGEIRLVTPADVVRTTGRSTPSGWPLMMLSASISMATFTIDSRSRKIWKGFWFSSWFIVILASLLTQSRTLVVGLGIACFIFIIGAFTVRPMKAKILNMGILAGVIPLAFILSFLLGRGFIRPDFSDYFIERYSVLQSVDTMLAYSGTDSRREEVILGLKRFASSPLMGVGLGSEYREGQFPVTEFEDPATLIHNIFAFFLFRYGPVGLLLFVLLVFRVLKSFRKALGSPSRQAALGIGLSIGIINLVVCGIFGNVFGTSYGVPQAMIALGCLISYESFRSKILSADTKSAEWAKKGSQVAKTSVFERLA